MLQCFSTLSTKLYPGASHVRPASQSRIAILFFKPRLPASIATKIADEEGLVAVDEEPECQKEKKGTKKKRVWRDSEVERFLV